MKHNNNNKPDKNQNEQIFNNRICKRIIPNQILEFSTNSKLQFALIFLVRTKSKKPRPGETNVYTPLGPLRKCS